MGLTLALFLVVRLQIGSYLRRHSQPPLTTTYSVLSNGPASVASDAWVIDGGFVDSAGHHLSDQQVFGPCEQNTGLGLDKQSIFQCIHDRGISQYITYQPADRFWPFQAIETALYVVVALGLLGFTVYWVRRRLS